MVLLLHKAAIVVVEYQAAHQSLSDAPARTLQTFWLSNTDEAAINGGFSPVDFMEPGTVIRAGPYQSIMT